nr:MAG TPA: NADH ubiquinone oxidoreductase, 20 Kd subunit [Caudoviricetes sp.]
MEREPCLGTCATSRPPPTLMIAGCGPSPQRILTPCTRMRTPCTART